MNQIAVDFFKGRDGKTFAEVVEVSAMAEKKDVQLALQEITRTCIKYNLNGFVIYTDPICQLQESND